MIDRIRIFLIISLLFRRSLLKPRHYPHPCNSKITIIILQVFLSSKSLGKERGSGLHSLSAGDSFLESQRAGDDGEKRGSENRAGKLPRFS